MDHAGVAQHDPINEKCLKPYYSLEMSLLYKHFNVLRWMLSKEKCHHLLMLCLSKLLGWGCPDVIPFEICLGF